jgi:GTP-binding protein HflX
VELLRHLLEVSEEINRRVGVLVDRRGQIQDVVVGSAERIYLPDLGRARAGAGRLRVVCAGFKLSFIKRRMHKDDLTDLGKMRARLLVNVCARQRRQTATSRGTLAAR